MKKMTIVPLIMIDFALKGMSMSQNIVKLSWMLLNLIMSMMNLRIRNIVPRVLFNVRNNRMIKPIDLLHYRQLKQ